MRSGTASFPEASVLLHWQLVMGQPHFEQTRPPSVE